MPNYDVFGNVDRYVLYYDSRIAELVWYPDTYERHPIWGQYLDRQDAFYEDRTIYPTDLTFPGPTTFTNRLEGVLPSVPRPAGMHGIGLIPNNYSGDFNPILLPALNLYPAYDIYPE